MTLHGNFVQILLIWHGIAHEIHPSTLMHDIACEFHPSTLVHGIACEISSTYFDPNDIACVCPMDIVNSSAICKIFKCIYIFLLIWGFKKRKSSTRKFGLWNIDIQDIKQVIYMNIVYTN
jgi:hypothetical protein